MAFDVSSVGATGNILMAAVTAAGRTVIENAACEPEIGALADFLVAMGAEIEGIGSPRIVVNGVRELHPADAMMIADGSKRVRFRCAAITGGDVETTLVDLRIWAPCSPNSRRRASIETGSRREGSGPERPEPLSVTTQPTPDS
jgi:UDP-N-acetylglucosamine 1-carboxyvinyltransferase